MGASADNTTDNTTDTRVGAALTAWLESGKLTDYFDYRQEIDRSNGIADRPCGCLQRTVWCEHHGWTVS